jgi:flagellar biosynthesis protein FlhF
MIEELCRQSDEPRSEHSPPQLAALFTELLDAEFDEESARALVEAVRVRCSREDLQDALVMRARLARLIEEQITCRGPIAVFPNQRRIVAVVGPTGVGKTTTIAKLAAHFHLRGHRRVGLVTVDTYRIAAVDQLRTYADIIDLPMEVVSTPREMRAALAKLADMELVLLDTAGRSPSDDVKIQELKSMLNEARADDVQLVVSAVGNASSLRMTAERFAPVGVNGLILTKVDEATALGHLVPLLRTCRMPLTYVTNGQDVPDDIVPAESRKLAHMILRLERGP